MLGQKPGSRGHQVPGRSVGFMPQETALYKDFSISEMLHYFGHLHHMERQEILSREQFLLSFLDLPSRSKRISQLRFGRESCVSLSHAFVFSPAVEVNSDASPWLALSFKNLNC